MGSDLIKGTISIKNKLIQFKKDNILKHIFFTLGNTRVLDSKNYYFTPFRLGENFILTGAVVFSEYEGKI